MSYNLLPKPGEKIVVWFSCGAASAVAAKVILDKYSKTNTIRIVNNPIKNEDEDNQRFLKDVEKWLGVEIEFAINSKYKSCDITEVFEDRQYISGNGGAPCTLELKKKARYEWEIKNRADWTVLGFTKEEKSRFDEFKLKERPASIWALESLSKGDCFKIIQDAGIELPNIYKLGYPNANCIGCVKASSPVYWNHVRKVHPIIFEERLKQSREIGAKLVRVHAKFLPFCELIDGDYFNKRTGEKVTVTKDGKKRHSIRIYLDELPLKAGGRSMKNMNVECGIFCNIN